MKVFVIGAGTMGSGIAQCFAAVGDDVKLCDISIEFAEKGIANVKAGLDKLVAKGKKTAEEVDALVKNLTPTASYQDAADCDLVIEAAVENIEIKKKVFAELDKVCKPETILSTNTSALSITEIASATKRPDKVIGMHYANPAPVMKLIEIIRGIETSDATYTFIEDASKHINKISVEIKECAGFVLNRILMTLVNEAIFTYADGIASAEGIDTTLKLGANMSMGPLELADLIGLDVVLAIMDTMVRETSDPKYRPHELLRKMVRARHLGRKTGRGFYDYSK